MAPPTIGSSESVQAHVASLFYVWDVATLSWTRGIQPSASGVTGDVNVVELVGSAPGATNPLPVRLTNGTSYDPNLAVTGPLTDTQLRASAVAVSGTVGTKTVLTAAAPTSVSVGASSGQVVASNSSRKGLVIVNVSTAVVSFGIGATAVLYDGITLYPQGVWCMDEYTFATGAINGIASVASSDVAVQEFS